MWIEIMLLSKLAKGPAHGYELRKDIEGSTGRTMSNNSLYPALRRFVESGAVLRDSEMQDAKPPRHVYTITEVGEELLHDLLTDLSEEQARNDPEFLARVANFSRLQPGERLRILRIRERAATQSRERLDAFRQAEADPWQRRVLDQICDKFDTELAWLADLREEIHAAGDDR